MPTRYQVGAVAERLGLSVRTLHHWDESGLVSPSARTSGGFRLYTEADIDRLLTVRRMKPLGFSIEEMRRLLDATDRLAEQPADPAARQVVDEFRERADASLDGLRQRVEWAEEFRALLDRI